MLDSAMAIASRSPISRCRVFLSLIRVLLTELATIREQTRASQVVQRSAVRDDYDCPVKMRNSRCAARSSAMSASEYRYGTLCSLSSACTWNRVS